MNEIVIYLGQQYSSIYKEVREQRFKIACDVTAKLMKLGFVVFSPILNSHPLDDAGLVPFGWTFWQKQDLPMLKRCDVLLVLKTDGWEQSKGLKGEIECANLDNIPQLYVRPCSINENLVNTIQELMWGVV